MFHRLFIAILAPALLLTLACNSEQKTAPQASTQTSHADIQAEKPAPKSAPASTNSAKTTQEDNGGDKNPKGLMTKPLFNRGKANAKTRAIIEMAKGGKIVLKFYPDVAPIHVSNFIHLAEKGFYDGLKFHRVVPDFVIQGGDPAGNGTGGPGWSVKAEFNKKKHIIGALSMARSQSPDSGGSQFFICLGAPSFLDGKYTVFGQTIAGQDIVNQVKVGDVMKKVTIQY